MTYSYTDHRDELFTEHGQVMFLQVRDQVHVLLRSAGAFTCEKALAGVTGDSWLMLACLDRLVELGEIRKVSDLGWTQGHVYAETPIRR